MLPENIGHDDVAARGFRGRTPPHLHRDHSVVLHEESHGCVGALGWTDEAELEHLGESVPADRWNPAPSPVPG